MDYVNRESYGEKERGVNRQKEREIQGGERDRKGERAGIWEGGKERMSVGMRDTSMQMDAWMDGQVEREREREREKGGEREGERERERRGESE